MNNWIEANYDYLKNKKINDIILPGTVNSFSFNPNFNENTEKEESVFKFLRKLKNVIPSLKSIFESWVKHQEYDIYKQLKIGIRVLDLKVTFFNKKWYTSNILLNDKVEEILNQINRFIKENPKEFIVIKFSLDRKNSVDLPNEIKSSFWEFLKTNYSFYSKLYQKSKIPTYGELVESKKNIIMIVDKFITSDYQYMIPSNFKKETVLVSKNLKTLNLKNWEEESSKYIKNASEIKNKFLEFNATIDINEQKIINDVICSIFDFFIDISSVLLILFVIWGGIKYKDYETFWDFADGETKLYYSIISLFLFTVAIKVGKNSMKYIKVKKQNMSCNNNNQGIVDKALHYQQITIKEILKNNNYKKFSIINSNYPSDNFIKLIIKLNNKPKEEDEEK